LALALKQAEIRLPFCAVCVSQEFAMKQVLCFTSESAKDAANELNVLQQLQHPNIVELVAGTLVPRGNTLTLDKLYTVSVGL
jgi:hypothetical protein